MPDPTGASRAQAREELFRIVAGVCSVTATNEILADFPRLAGLLGYVKADGARTLGKRLAEWQTAAVEATQSHDLINEEGDGDWQVVYERLLSLRDNYARVGGWSWGVYHPKGYYTDLYGDEATAREMQKDLGGQLVRTPLCDWEVVTDAVQG